jgi:hypothetical protein
VPLAIERIETSCPCIGMGGVPVQLEPDETKNLRVTFDPSYDPDFAGRLSVQVTAYLTDGSLAFQTKVNLDVHPERRDRQH